MKRLCLAVSFLLVSALTFAQRGSVTGTAIDTLASGKVSDVTISVLKKKDSSLVSFNITSNAGQFTISNLADGEYLLMASHINYHTVSRAFEIRPDNKTADLGSIVLTDRSVTLAGVKVSSDAPPITMVGDTVQYHADAFKTQPNASVEQLLKKLPGIQVDKQGNIKSNGQQVKRVFVDGKEFFGDDPKMATKNLPADAVDKVQVYDRKSDQAQLTGFDDGTSETTINLKLKQDKKKGLFGKLAGGAGTDDRAEARASVNSFKGARQLSLIGTANNTNAEGFSFSDLLSFSGDMGRLARGGSISTDQLSALASSSSTNTGIRTIAGAGVNYNNIIGKRTEFTSNYFYNYFRPDLTADVQRTYLLPDSSYRYDQSSVSRTANNSHRLNLGIDHRIDSFHSLKINPSIALQHTRSVSSSAYQQSGSDNRLSNAGFNNYNRAGDALNVQVDALFRKKFRRRGRTFSLSLKTILNSSDADAAQESVNTFYPAGAAPYRDSINQRSAESATQNGITGRAVYTEPLFKRSLLELSVASSTTKSGTEKKSYDFNKGTGGYDLLNDSLSNDFETTYGYMDAGVRLRSARKKLNYSVGVTWQNAMLEGRVLTGSKDVDLGKDFYNLLPNARVQYTFMRNKTLVLNYSTYTQQPSVSQLQPVPDISNGINIYEGNPALKQEYSHNLALNYTGINPFRNRNLFIFLTLNRTDNKIVNADSLFSNGVKKTRPVNTNGVYNLTGDINAGLPLRMLKATMQAGFRSSYYRGRQFINGAPNTVSTVVVGPRFSINSAPSEKLDLQAGASFNFNRSNYSLQRTFNNQFLTQVYEAEINWELPAKFFLSSDFTYTVNNQLADGFNARVPLWNASLAKQLGKTNRAELKFRINDLLNRNTGVNRTSNQGYIEDSRVNTLRRYALLMFTYSLGKTGAGTAPTFILRK